MAGGDVAEHVGVRLVEGSDDLGVLGTRQGRIAGVFVHERPRQRDEPEVAAVGHQQQLRAGRRAHVRGARIDGRPLVPSAKSITDFAPHVASLFPPGTGPDVGKTGAKPEIWQDPQDFTAKAGDFQKAAQAFGGAVQSGDMNAIKATWADLGKSCKACHDKYRAEMHH